MREAAAFDLLSILSYIIVQRLLKTKDGRRKAVREYLVIDNSLRRKLYDVDYSKWGRYIDDLLIAENRSLIQNAWQCTRRFDRRSGSHRGRRIYGLSGVKRGQVWTLTNGVMPAGH